MEESAAINSSLLTNFINNYLVSKVALAMIIFVVPEATNFPSH